MRDKCQKCKGNYELVEIYSWGKIFKLCSFCYGLVKDKPTGQSIDIFMRRGNGLKLGKETYSALRARTLRNTGKGPWEKLSMAEACDCVINKVRV